MKRTPTQNYLIKLRTILEKRFNESELRTLCFDLFIDYDDLPGSGKADKARELVAYCHRHQRIHNLVAAIIEFRPDVSVDVADKADQSEPSSSQHFFSQAVASSTRTSKITDTQLYSYIVVSLIGTIVGVASVVIPALLLGIPQDTAGTEMEIYIVTGFLGAFVASAALSIYADVKLIQTDTFWRRLPPAALFGIAGGWVGGIIGLLIPCFVVIGSIVLIWWILNKIF